LSGDSPEPGGAITGENRGSEVADDPFGTAQADSTGIPQTRRKEHAIRKPIMPHTRLIEPDPVLSKIINSEYTKNNGGIHPTKVLSGQNLAFINRGMRCFYGRRKPLRPAAQGLV